MLAHYLPKICKSLKPTNHAAGWKYSSLLSCHQPKRHASTKTDGKSQPKLYVDLYFDTVSPYSWPAFEVLSRYRDRWNLSIQWKPVFMGGLVTASGNPYLSSLMECPNKARYSFNDLERTANFFDVPLRLKEDPITHIGVIGSLQQQRFATAVLELYPDRFEEVCRQIWTRSWGQEDATVHTKDDLSVVAERAGLSQDQTAECINAAKSDAIKARLKLTTEEASELGAFGVPTAFYSTAQPDSSKPDDEAEDRHMVFGSDRFELVAFLYGKTWDGPCPK